MPARPQISISPPGEPQNAQVFQAVEIVDYTASIISYMACTNTILKAGDFGTASLAMRSLLTTERLYAPTVSHAGIYSSWKVATDLCKCQQQNRHGTSPAAQIAQSESIHQSCG
jgi:hypothetical protein